VHFQQLFFDRQKCVTITINDITSVERNVALKAKNKMLNTMQASISHELLTPLKCIKSITELIKEDHEYDKQLCENLETIDTSVQLVLSQIKQKLDYALIDSGRFNLHLEPLRLVNDVLIPTIKTFKGQIFMQKIKLLVSVPIDEQYVTIDKLRT
jgi:signal transduction histidine kinase